MKNFIVIARPVKNHADGVSNLLRYLNNPNEPSHKNTEIVVFQDNCAEFKKSCIMNANELYLQNKKGGRKVKNLAQSFSLNLPKSIACSVDQWNSIEDGISSHICDYLGIERGDVYLNVHKERLKNSHLNVVVKKVVFDKKQQKYRSLYNLDRLNFLYSLKCKFNEMVKKHCNFDVVDYQVVNKTEPAVQKFNYIQSVGLPALVNQVDQLEVQKTALEVSVRAFEAQKLDLDVKIALSRENGLKQLLKTREFIEGFNKKLRKKQKELQEKQLELQELSNNKFIRMIKSILKNTEVEDLRKMVYQLESENKTLVELKYSNTSNSVENMKELKQQLKTLKKQNAELVENNKIFAIQNSPKLQNK